MTRLPPTLAAYDAPETGWYAVGVTNNGEHVIYADTQLTVHR
ncbi:hypothetical protein [Haladaptatus halobius]|nr:hypothetical protein [Haladaptatus halobius]